VLDVHCRINARGVGVDAAFAACLRDLWAQNGEAAADAVDALTGSALHGGNVRSVPQVKRWLAEHGLRVESLNRQQMERLYADPVAFFDDECHA
jgi:hypothetical protein